MRTAVFSLSVLAMVGAAEAAEDFEKGRWQKVFADDFKGMRFVGVSKHKFCVEQAFLKAKDVENRGGVYEPVLRLTDIVQIAAVTEDGKQLMIVCSPNGALAVYFNVPPNVSDVYTSMEGIGSEPSLDGPQKVETKTTIDLNTGKATSVTTMPAQ